MNSERTPEAVASLLIAAARLRAFSDEESEGAAGTGLSEDGESEDEGEETAGDDDDEEEEDA